jgi:polysaccharide biosynthesis protein PslH
MRLLFVASRFPYPPRYGDQVRGFHHLRILSRRHQIALVSPPPEAGGKEALAAVEPFCDQMHLVRSSVGRGLLRLMRAPLTSLPFQTLYFCDPHLRRQVLTLLRAQRFDLLHVQMVRMAPVAHNLDAQIPMVLDFIDALSVNMAHRARRGFTPQALVAGWESQRIQSYERRLVQRYDQLVISSPLDRKAIGEFNNLHVVPNGVDLEVYPFVRDGRETATLVFTGTMWYFPNVDAASWFVTSVLPLVCRQVSETRILVVGTRPAPAVQRLACPPHVIVTGHVPSVQDYLARATIAVAPMQSGSGMQFKVIEAMASGAPVVATPYALGGLEAVDGEHLLVAHDAESFAECVVRLLRNPELRLQLAMNARKLVEEKYAWEQTVAKLEAVYDLAVSTRRPV